MAPQHGRNDPDMLEKLRMENDFMKMKLMLEHGARFHPGKAGGGLDPAVEYAFLKQVLAFEEQYATGRRQTVFEKLGRPADIRPVRTLADGELPGALEELHRRLQAGGIHLTTLSPDVHPRELYRFMTEELLQVELCAADSPGMHCFVYDEFHPDPRQQNEHTAVDLCIRLILQKKNLLHMFPAGRPIRLNGPESLGESEFRHRVHTFKSRYEDIVPVRIQATRTELRDKRCQVSGTHVTGLCLDGRCDMVQDRWEVGFRQDANGEWLVTDVRIDGVGL